MEWKYRLKRALRDRYALSAVLFLLILLWGVCTAFFGPLTDATACGGYKRPAPQKSLTDLSKTPGEVCAADLTVPAELPGWDERLTDAAAALERTVGDALEADHTLIQLYGGFQCLSARTVVEDMDPSYTVARLEGGSLTFLGSGEGNAQAQAAQLRRFRHLLDQRDVPLLYLQAPSKLDPEGAGLPVGVTDTGNACADRLLAALAEADIDTLDLRQTLKEAGGTWEDWFYATDHHWTAEAAFVAFQAVADRLEDYYVTRTVAFGPRRERLTIQERFTDPDSYRVEVLEDFFLGSQGKRVGSLYAGADDFSLWTPRFATLMRYSARTPGYGDALDTVLYPQRVARRDFFGGNPYTYYAGGDYASARTVNYYNPQGPRLVLLRDSFGCAITPFLAYACSELTTIDPRSYTGDLMAYIDQLKPDAVLILCSPGATRTADFFNFLPQPPAPSKTLG